VATGERYGPVDGGELVFMGTREYKPSIKDQLAKRDDNNVASIAYEVLSSLGRTRAVPNGQTYTGRVSWPLSISQQEFMRNSSIVMKTLITQGYLLTETADMPQRTAVIVLSSFHGGEIIPHQVIPDWEIAVQLANGINGGIHRNS
jgi:hypothetical protein